MTTAWSHLPNAAFIDEVLTSLEARPEKWVAARDAAWSEAWGAARSTHQTAACSAAQGAAWDVAWGAARRAGRGAAYNAAHDAARARARRAQTAARLAISALTAYDDAGQFMKLPVGHLRMLHRLDPHPMYLLLQPAAIVFARQRELLHRQQDGGT